MDAINVLITGAGAPGTKGTIYSLRNNFDGRAIRIIGVDIRKDVVGKYLCDSFYQIPRPTESSFVHTLCDICRKEKVDAILPLVEDELPVLSAYQETFNRQGTKVAISERRALELSISKYNLMQISKELDLPTAKYYLVSTFEGLEKGLEELGWPDKSVVVKPPISSGMRGLRIVKEFFDGKETFYTEKPSGIYLRKDELRDILGNSFPELLVMEFLPGREYSVDILAANYTVIIPRTRDFIRTGITFDATVEKNQEIIGYAKKLAGRLGLKYAFGFQFKLDANNTPKVIECNSRIQGTMILSTFAGANIIYGAVKHALGEEVPEFKIKWGTRLLRYWGGIAVINGKTVGEIL